MINLAEETMDATYAFLKRIAPFLALALLIIAPANAQVTLSLSSTSVVLNNNQAQSINVSASNGTSISYTISGTPSWLSVTSGNTGSSTAGTTPDTLYFRILNSSCGTCSAAVTLTPAGGGAASSVTVAYNPNGGGGGTGGLTATPASLSMSAFIGQTTSQNVTLSTTSTTPITFSWVSSASWLTAATNTFTVSNNSPATLTITANATGLANTQYSAQITVTPSVGTQVPIGVTFNVGSGTGGSSSYTLNPSNVTLAYPASPGGYCVNGGTVSSCTVLVNSTNSSVSTYNAYVQNVTGTGTWLLVNGGTQSFSTSVSNGAGISVSPTYVPGTGTYSGQVVIYNPNNSSDQVIVNVTLIVNGGGSSGSFGISPTSMSFTASNGVAPAAQLLSVNAPNATFSLSTSYLNGNGWLTISPCCTLSGTQNLTFSVNPSGLAIGNYNAYTYVTSGSTTLQVLVSLAVTSGGGSTTGSIVAPTSLSFAYETNQNVPIYQLLSLAPSGSFTTTTTVSGTTQQWLNATSAGTGPGYITVSVVPQGLSAGTYQGNITVNTTSGSQSVTVTLLVSSSDVLMANPSTINFSYASGSGTASYPLQVTASDGSNQALSVTSPNSWITIGSATSATTPSQFIVSVNPSGLCNGLNVGTVTATASAANSPLTIPIVVLVSGSSATSCSGGTSSGPLTLGSGSLTFSAPFSGSTQSQILGVSANTTTGFTVYTSTFSGGSWLSVIQNGAVVSNGQFLYTPQNLTVTANPSGLSTGTYTGQVQFLTNGTTQTVSITFNVGTGTGGSGNISVNPTSVSFTVPASTTTTSTQNLAVTSTSGSSGIQFTYNATSTGNWLSAANNGTAIGNGTVLATPVTITVIANPAGLTTGTYTGTITLSPSGGSQVTVQVTFTIQPSAVVSASPTTLTFSYRAGDAAPAAQSVQVTGGTSGANLTFSAQASSTGNWLVVSPAAGTTPGTVSVSVSPSSLSAGTYNGTVTVAGTGSATGSTTINVSITVTAPLPTITSIGNAGSYVGGSISPGEIITIFGTSLGPTPAATSLTIDPSTGLVSTTLGNVQVLINGFLAPMVYASATQVTAVVPYELARFLSATVQVKYVGQTSNGISASVASTAVGIFTANASGTGPAACLNANSTQNSIANPAAKGETVAIYLTGEGQTTPAGVTGKVTTISAVGPLTPTPLLPIAVRIDGQPAAIAFAGEAPSLISGVMQLNVQIPTTASSGAVTLEVTIGGNNSQAGVTLNVR